MPENHWITLHRVRFPDRRSASDWSVQQPEGLEVWRFCPSQEIGEDGLPTWVSDTWCAMAVHPTREAAEAMFHSPDTACPAFAEAEESWHALAVPVNHRGEVNWRGTVEENTALQVADAAEPGAFAVITTAGFETRDVARVRVFLKGVAEVVDFYAGLETNLRSGVYNGGFDLRDGFTLSLWRDEASMMEAAYHPGIHRTLMDQSRGKTMFDRSSFSRLHVLASQGSWDGDPLAA